MEMDQKILVTVIGEAALEQGLAKVIGEVGAAGYTISDVRGAGDQGERSGEFEQAGNIKMEVICGASTAEQLARSIREKFFANYALILFTSPVTVLRSQKFR